MHNAEADWSLLPSVRVGQEYNDNFNLTTIPLEVLNTYFAGNILSSVQTEQSQTDLFGEYRGYRYWDQSQLDADDGTLRLSTNFNTEYTRTEFLAEAILDHPSSTQLLAGNQVFDRIERLSWSLSPGWTWIPTEFSTLKLSYSYNDLSYSEAPNFQTSLSDFFTHSVNASYTYTWDEYTSIFSDFLFVKTVNDEQMFKSDQFNLQIGLNHSFTETFDISLSAGGIILTSKFPVLVPNFRTLRFDIVSTNSTQSGYTINASVRKRYAYTNLSARYGRNLAPTINGGQVVQDSFRFSAEHQLSKVLVGNLNFGLLQWQNIALTISQPDRRQAFANVALTWQFDEAWSLDGGYRFDWLDRDGSPATNRNSVYININYNWDPIFLD